MKLSNAIDMIITVMFVLGEAIMYVFAIVVVIIALSGCSSPEGQWQCRRAGNFCRDVHYVLSGAALADAIEERIEDG